MSQYCIANNKKESQNGKKKKKYNNFTHKNVTEKKITYSTTYLYLQWLFADTLINNYL